MKEKIAYYATDSYVFQPGESVYINIAYEKSEPHLHAHDFIEIAYVASGEGIHQIAGRKYNVSMGDLFVINYDIAHEFRSSSDKSKPPLVVYNCIFKPEFIDFSLIKYKDFSAITNHFLFRSLFPDENIEQHNIHLVGKDCNDIDALYRKMYNEYTNKSNGYIEILRAYVIELLVTIFRLYNGNQRIQDEFFVQRNEIIKNAMNYMKDNYQKGVSLDELSAMSFLSRNYFCKLFKETTNLTVSEYIQDVRIHKACELLKNTDKAIMEIASMVGYKDIKFFNEIFKRKTGQSPRNYRNKSSAYL